MSAPARDHPEGYEWEVIVVCRDFFSQPFEHKPVRVRAWDLPTALRKAAEVPLAEFFHPEPDWW